MTPLERAARAYHDSTRQFRYIRDPMRPAEKPVAQPAPFVEWDKLDDETKAERINQVRAVLEAIREPSEGMMEHLLSHFEDTYADKRASATASFRIMIDAALQEG